MLNCGNKRDNYIFHATPTFVACYFCFPRNGIQHDPLFSWDNPSIVLVSSDVRLSNNSNKFERDPHFIRARYVTLKWRPDKALE